MPFGAPLLYLYLYWIWLLIIVLLIRVVERSEIREISEQDGSESSASESLSKTAVVVKSNGDNEFTESS